MVRSPIRKSLLRRISWFGGDRMLVGSSGMTLLLVGVVMFRGFGILYGLTVIVPVVLWVAVLWVAREAFKADPFMVLVVLRQFRYRKFYAAKPDLGIQHPEVKDYI